MSKWRKALKNKRRFDARYFLNERVENQEVVESSVQQEEVKRNFNDFSFDSWLTEAEEVIDESVAPDFLEGILGEDREALTKAWQAWKRAEKEFKDADDKANSSGYARNAEDAWENETFMMARSFAKDRAIAAKEKFLQMKKGLDEAHCGSHKRDDEEELEEAKGKHDDGDGKDEKCDYVDCEGVEEGLEELQVHPHTAKDFSGAIVPIKDEEPPVKKKKNKKEVPVDYDPPMGLEESEIEEG